MADKTSPSTQVAPKGETANWKDMGDGTYAPVVSEVPQPSNAFTIGSKTTNAATRAQLHAGQACREVLVTAKPGNTGWVYIGDVTVSSTVFGKRLGADQSLKAAVNNLNLIYIDVSVNGEGVDFIYV